MKHSDLPIGFHPVHRTTSMPRGKRLEPSRIGPHYRAPRPSKSDDPAYRKQAVAL